MSSINIDFEAAAEVIKTFTNICFTINSTVNITKAINNGFLGAYSKRASDLTADLQSNVAIAARDMEDLRNEFNTIIEKYREAQERIKNMVLDLSVSTGASVSSAAKNFAIHKQKIKAKFVLGEKGDTKELKEISASDIEAMFLKNGATKNGDVCMMTIGGKTYGYNTSNNKLTLDGQEIDYYCKFFATETTNIEDITNTITILAGRDALDTSHGPTGHPNSELFTGVYANDNSLIIIPYGNDRNYQRGAMVPCVSASTQIGDFLVNGGNEKLSNSIIGYSYGGMVAYSTISENGGLYDTFFHVNTYCLLYDKNYIDQINYDSFKDMQIIMFEGDHEEYNAEYINGTLRTLQNFTENGVPAENIEVYSPSDPLRAGARKYIGPDQTHNVNSEEVARGKCWREHSKGMFIVRDYGLLDYLSRDRSVYE